ncbi:hypothetical protein RN001_012059 [Aquatica leii]|uniref:Carboxypeptidase n=1 Tax=Aquatica leii TaxID=1421715 RepID=A0AAN7P3B4_9COLE|nr:hypothetical protein RN001_012059 [Aquatica leii]
MNLFQSVVCNGQTNGPLILTPLLEKNQTKEAQEAAQVKNKQLFGDIISYSGYFTVNKRFNSNTFFWFFPSENNWKKDPVLLWLNGGPGSTSLFGLFIENGPFNVISNSSVQIRKYRWTKTYSVIYIDNPVGVGYSFTKKGGRPNNQFGFGEHLYSAVVQFFQLFPELKNNDFYLTGESYAGKYLPALALQIEQKSTGSNKINLKGLIIGNGFFMPKHLISRVVEFVYAVGLLDEHQKFEVDLLKEIIINCINFQLWTLATKFTLRLNSLVANYSGYNVIFNIAQPKGSTTEQEVLMNSFLQREDVKKAIHVQNITFNVFKFEINVQDFLEDLMKDVAAWIEQLLNKYPILFYTGHWDIVATYIGTTTALRSLNFIGSHKYRTAKRRFWYVDGELAGYIKEGGNLKEALIRNAGHMAPADQPLWTYKLITSFINNHSNILTTICRHERESLEFIELTSEDEDHTDVATEINNAIVTKVLNSKIEGGINSNVANDAGSDIPTMNTEEVYFLIIYKLLITYLISKLATF